MAEITHIIAKLIERTDQGKVAWKPTASEQTFVAVIGNTSVRVTKGLVHSLELKVLDRAGREIYALDDNQSGEYRKDLAQLHEKARRFALGVDRQLEELLAELERV